jgi:hypothetical protein
MVALALAFAVVLGPGFTGAAAAASEDVAMFYDDLAQHGQWVEYGEYGPVWRPSQVQEDWRPYTNGRWVPTEDGNVFESEEPWGWATYHYGNWMPTESNGWVWVPGRTWYPSTVEWRTSPESEPVESSYIGWAPTPPPSYVPPPAYAPPSYYQGSPVTDALIAPLWIFVKAAQFLLGFGQPYTPAYSYGNSGFLMPPAYVPVFFSRTVFIPAYATPTYYPPAFFRGRKFGAGYYNMGPSGPYLSRVTNINQTIINQTIIRNSTNITRIHNVVPPRGVMARHGYVRQIIPPALAKGHRLPPPRLADNVKLAQVNLNRPNFVPPPKNVPQITAKIPRVQPGAHLTGQGLPGTALPARATMPLTPHMTQEIQKLPPKQQFVPGKSQPFIPATATRPGPGQVRPGQAPPGVPAQPGQPGGPGKPGPGQAIVPTQPGQVQPGAPTRPGPVRPGVPAQPGTPPKPGQITAPTKPAPVKPVTPPAGQAKPGEFHPGVRPPGGTPGRTPATPTTPGATKPGPAPLPPGYKGLTPEQRRQQEIEHQRRQRGGTPGQPQQAQPQQQLQQQQRQQQERMRQQQQQQQQRQQQMNQQRQQQQQQQRQQQMQQQQQRQQQIQQQQQRQQQIQQQQRQQQQQQRQQQPQKERKKHEQQQ